MTLSEKIHYLRIKNNMTLEEVGNLVGVGKSTVRKWETGQIKNMRRDKIAKLAVALKTTPDYLLGWDGQKLSSQIKQELIGYVENIDDDEELLKILTVLKTIRGDKNE